jgi:hypothetical protein
MIRIQSTIFMEQVDLVLHNDKRPDHRHASLEFEPAKDVDASVQYPIDALRWVQSE